MSRFTDLIFGKRDSQPTAARMFGFGNDGGLMPSSITPTTSLGLSAVWRCLDILANSVSQLEWTEKRNGLDLPPSRLVRRPQVERTRREWVQLIVRTTALYDVAYCLKTPERDAEGTPLGLLYLQPSIVIPKTVDVFTILPPQEYYVLGRVVSADDLVIFRRGPVPGLYDTVGGVMSVARAMFAGAIAAENYASRYWQSGGSPQGYLTTDANLPDTVSEQMSDRWREKRAMGPDYWPVLSGGLHAEQAGADATSIAAVEARKQQVADIGRYFGIPTHVLNSPQGDTQTYHSSESGNQDLIRYTIQNYVDMIGDAVSDVLPGSRHISMETWPLRAGTLFEQAQAFQLMTGGKAVMSVDEVRDMIELPVQEDPDELNPPPPAPVMAAPMTGGPNGQ